MRVLLVDNFDSFVYNLAQYLGALGAEPIVLRSDSSLEQLESVEPDAVVVSPGPGRPEDAGVSVEAIRAFGERLPVLGVCLGHQAIGVAYGAKVGPAPGVVHGKTSEVEHDGKGVFEGLPSAFEATRYHSLVIYPETVPAELEVSAVTSDGVVMGVRHRHLSVEGVQFHPESVLTEPGMDLLANFLRGVR